MYVHVSEASVGYSVQSLGAGVRGGPELYGSGVGNWAHVLWKRGELLLYAEPPL